jgi:hypothetical protein
MVLESTSILFSRNRLYHYQRTRTLTIWEKHGTHVAGIVAAKRNNAVGISGIAPAQILSVRVLNGDGVGFQDDVADGITWAVNNGAKIVNLSLGGPADSVLQTAVQNAWNNGVILVAASGNNGTNSISYPAAYPEVIAVGALTEANSRAAYSNYGAGLALVAPGSNILSALPDSEYGFLSGTSMAAPHVTGVAALLLAHRSSLTNSQVRDILQSSADDLGASGRDDFFGYGRVNAFTALLAVVGQRNFQVVSVYNDGQANVEVTGVTDNGQWLQASPSSFVIVADTSQSFYVIVNTAGLAGGTYTANVSIPSNDPDENPSLLPVQLTISNATTAIALLSGWNLISLPISPTVTYTAESMGDEINAQGGNCTKLDRWYGGWDTHVNGLPFNNFSINIGAGYFIKCTQSSTWTLQGATINQPNSVNLFPGWNLISVPYLPAPLSAEGMGDEINAQGGNCSEVDRWYGGWDFHVNGLPFNDFAIEKGKGYFVKCSVSSTYTHGGTGQSAPSPRPRASSFDSLRVRSTAPTISKVRIANVRDTGFSISWVTSVPAHGWINFGTTTALGEFAPDNRGATIVDDTHHATVTNLKPNTTYYFDLMSDGTVDSNNGAHYRVTTGPTLSLPTSDVIYGQVFKRDGRTPADGALVYVTVSDKDGKGSPGSSALLSTIVDRSGYWQTNLGNLRLGALGGYFAYSASSDVLSIEVEAAADGGIKQTMDTTPHAPVTHLTLTSQQQRNFYLPFVLK